MALRLFHPTGYDTLLPPRQARQGTHPAWLVLAVSLWIGLACNVAVWRLAADGFAGLRSLLATSALLAGGSGIVLSLLGWRRTLRVACTVVLLVAALLACGIWVQELPPESLWQQRPRSLLPAWPNFMRWQVPVLLLVLALLPIVGVWNVALRRLPAPQQLQSNIVGVLLAALVLGVGLVLLP